MTTYSYDGRGNLSAASVMLAGATAPDVTTYAWDAQNRMTGVTQPDGTQITYGYDADGRRVTAAQGAMTRNFVWDEISQYGDVVAELDASGGLVTGYVLANGAIVSQTTNGASSHFFADSLGSTRALTDAGGAVTDTYSYTAYGETYASTGSTSNSYLYAGQQYDSATGLYSMRARMYDPGVGRFVSRDTWPLNMHNPVEWNRYGYTVGDPVNGRDPSGYVNVPSTAMHLSTTIDPNGLRPKQGALIGAVLGAAQSGIMAIQRWQLMQNDFCGDWGIKFTESMTFIQYLGLSVSTGGLFGAIIGHISGGGTIGPPELTRFAFALSVAYFFPSVLDLAFGVDKGWCGVLDLAFGLLGFINGGNLPGMPPKFAPSGGGVVVAPVLVPAVDIPAIIERWLEAAMNSGGQSDQGDSGGSGGNQGDYQVTESTIREAMEGAELRTHQTAVSLPKVQDIVQRYLNGERPLVYSDFIQVDDGIIVDGNHRYIASRILNVDWPIRASILPSRYRSEPIIGWQEIFIDLLSCKECVSQ